MVFERKQELADRLLKRGITLYYMGDESPTVFVGTEQMSADEIKEMLFQEGYEIKGNAKEGFFALSYQKVDGYWCDLQNVDRIPADVKEPDFLGVKICPVCQNEELHPCQKYCQICGSALFKKSDTAVRLRRNGSEEKEND